MVKIVILKTFNYVMNTLYRDKIKLFNSQSINAEMVEIISIGKNRYI